MFYFIRKITQNPRVISAKEKTQCYSLGQVGRITDLQE